MAKSKYWIGDKEGLSRKATGSRSVAARVFLEPLRWWWEASKWLCTPELSVKPRHQTQERDCPTRVAERASEQVPWTEPTLSPEPHPGRPAGN